VKSTGIVRIIDDFGRLVLPKEMRRTMDIGEGDPVEVFTEGDSIVLKKYERGCTFCGELNGTMMDFGGQKICQKCRPILREALK